MKSWKNLNRGATATILAVIALVLADARGEIRGAPLATTTPPASPAPPNSERSPVLVAPNAVTTAMGKSLQSTLFRQDIPSNPMALPAGYVSLGKTSITCPTTSSTQCTVEIDQHVQVLGKTSSANLFALCVNIDNVRVTCPNVGLMPNNNWIVGSYTHWKSGVAPGNHSAEAFVYSAHGGLRSYYTVVYRIYK